MTAENEPVADWVLALVDAFLEPDRGFDMSDTRIPLEVIKRISAHNARRKTIDQRIAEIKARRAAYTCWPAPLTQPARTRAEAVEIFESNAATDIDWLLAEVEAFYVH